MTAHPKDLSDELIERHARLPNLMPSVHIPMQSGSTKILRKMNRHYSKEDYLALVEKIRNAGARSAFSDIAITTDIMVGFPSESDEDFAETLDAVRKARFDSAFTFIYSKRSGTKAADFAGEIAPEVSRARFNALLDVLHPIMFEENEKRVGKTYSVLVDEESKKDSAFLTGKTEAGIPVNFKRGSEKIGDIRRVKITEAREFYLKGEGA
jgi:tRNA-2-methylthio-N6-dimethylallyladenosine synthase